MDVVELRQFYIDNVRMGQGEIEPAVALKLSRASARHPGDGLKCPRTKRKAVSQDLAWDYCLTGEGFQLVFVLLSGV